ncbi:TIGR02588 family protein [Rhizobium rhizosphaerae]|uniref:TIGR02588 family protein n=1 Tax=Xaviernesmea rhizosphaerae TaxID=1672749 RepID=A0A1Q9AIU2_9HYPH|nr:TIGR02588 family protein [Xaviernesmea rhizosphaerae]OLP55169.1 TIGR02588 family protein [Xaviernesmea rhizosphaerae]
MSGQKTKKTVEAQGHWIEWATGLISGLLVIAMIGIVALDALTASDAAPDLKVTIINQRPTSGGTQVSFIVSNLGKRSAAGVPVTGLLSREGRVVERREVIFDYVPAQSQEKGALIFSENPDGAQLELHTSGYRDP